MIQIKAWNILNCLFCQYNSNKIHVGSRLLIERSSLQWKIYRITGFFCANFCDLSPKWVHVFCDFIFCDFTSWQSDFYSLDDMKKLRVNLKHPAFLRACAFALKSGSFSPLLNISINPSRNTYVLFL